MTTRVRDVNSGVYVMVGKKGSGKDGLPGLPSLGKKPFQFLQSDEVKQAGETESTSSLLAQAGALVNMGAPMFTSAPA